MAVLPNMVHEADENICLSLQGILFLEFVENLTNVSDLLIYGHNKYPRCWINGVFWGLSARLPTVTSTVPLGPLYCCQDIQIVLPVLLQCCPPPCSSANGISTALQETSLYGINMTWEPALQWSAIFFFKSSLMLLPMKSTIFTPATGNSSFLWEHHCNSNFLLANFHSFLWSCKVKMKNLQLFLRIFQKTLFELEWWRKVLKKIKNLILGLHGNFKSTSFQEEKKLQLLLNGI